MWICQIFPSYSILFLVVTVGRRMGSVKSFASKNKLQQSRQREISKEHSQRQPMCYSRRTASIDISSSKTTRLFSSDPDDNSIRFLGRGPNAIVRPGVVLLAPAEEYHHYLRQSAVFIYAMGTDDTDEYVIRGVVLDNPTPFTMGEMMENKVSGGIYENLIFRGGESGGQEAFCFNSVDALGLEEIGTSSVYQGGELDKFEDPSKVKFFFNYMEFLEQELEDMLEIIQEDGDGWTSVEVPPEMVLNPDYGKGEAWGRLRNTIRRNGNGFSNGTE